MESSIEEIVRELPLSASVQSQTNLVRNSSGLFLNGYEITFWNSPSALLDNQIYLKTMPFEEASSFLGEKPWVAWKEPNKEADHCFPQLPLQIIIRWEQINQPGRTIQIWLEGHGIANWYWIPVEVWIRHNTCFNSTQGRFLLGRFRYNKVETDFFLQQQLSVHLRIRLFWIKTSSPRIL